MFKVFDKQLISITEIVLKSLRTSDGQIGMKLGTKHVIYQKIAIFFVKKVSILSGLKVSSLTWKCVYCRPKHAKEGSQGTEFRKFWNKEMKYTNA